MSNYRYNAVKVEVTTENYMPCVFDAVEDTVTGEVALFGWAESARDVAAGLYDGRYDRHVFAWRTNDVEVVR